MTSEQKSKSLSPEEKFDLYSSELAQKKFVCFLPAVDPKYRVSWHHDIVAQKLQEAYEKLKLGQRSRIMLLLPPRHGKTEEASIKFPAWVLGNDPTIPIIVTSYAQERATDLGLSTRDLMDSDNYKAIFETRLRADIQAKAKWMTEENGGYTAVGFGGSITGRGGKILIVDDPFKNREEADSEVIRNSRWGWYRSTFLTREDGNGAIIVILTRWHDDDLAGRILALEPNDWDVINFPAIAEEDEQYRKKGEALWPERFPLEILEQRKKSLGPYEWSSLYQQSPVSMEGGEFQKSWFIKRSWAEIERLETRRFVTIDPASAMRDRSDFIGITINYVDRENKWNFKSFRVKMNSKDLISLMFKIYSETNFEKIGIEEGVYRDAIKPFLDEEMRRRDQFFEVVELKHQQQQKVIRIRGLVPRYASGSIFHIEDECSDLEEELLRFPKGLIDDTCDSAAYQNQIAEAPEADELEQRLSIQRKREARHRNELLP